MCDVADAEAVVGEWVACPLCHGHGMMAIAHSVRLEIPPGAQSGDRYQIDLWSEGSENLLLDMAVIVREKALHGYCGVLQGELKSESKPKNLPRQVTVLEDGMPFHGQRYRSLSAVAWAITGGNWSGPLFFGRSPGRGA
jgi:hypothetical protein